MPSLDLPPPALALTLALLAGDALAVDRLPLAEAHRAAITSTRTIANLAQDELGFAFRSLFIPGGFASSYVNEHREREAREAAGKLEAALEGYDPRPRMKVALEQELAKAVPFQGTRVELQRHGALTGGMARAITAEAGADAVLVVDLRYGLSDGASFMVVSGSAALLPTRSAADPGLKKAFGSSAGDLPVTPLYRAVFMAAVPAPDGDEDDAARWTKEACAPARRAIEGGIAEVARMIVWDSGQGELPARWPYSAPRDAWVALKQFGGDFEGVPALTAGERTWYRGRGGELVSMGDAYAKLELGPFAPPGPDEPAAAPPVADEAGRLTFGFASAERTLQGGAVTAAWSSERPGDVEYRERRFVDGRLAVTGQVGLGKRSSWAHLGARWALQRRQEPVDATRFRSVTVRLGATTRALRVRLIGRGPPGQDHACHPVHVVEDVEETQQEFTIPFSRFAAEGWCGKKAVLVKEVLPELVGLEVVSTRMTQQPLTVWIGPVTFNP